MEFSCKFDEGVVIGYTGDLEPIHGDRLVVKVNGQVFQRHFKALTIDDKDVDRLERKRIEMLAVALGLISGEIKHQAVHGKPLKIKYNGGEVVRF